MRMAVKISGERTRAGWYLFIYIMCIINSIERLYIKITVAIKQLFQKQLHLIDSHFNC